MSEAGFTYLKELHPHERDSHIRFEDEGHLYFINEELCKKQDGWTSCTTFVHSLFPKFNADEVITRIMKKKDFHSGPYAGMTRQQIKQQWDNNGKEACRVGSKFHLELPETYYNNEPLEDDDELADFRVKFMKFVEDHQHLKPYRTEMMVYCEELKITGSIDMIFEEPDGTLSIYDWKISKLIEMTSSFKSDTADHPLIQHLVNKNGVHYSLQLNIYKFLLEKHYGKKIKDLYLIRFYKNVETYEKIKCLDLQNEVRDLFDDRLQKLTPKHDPKEPPVIVMYQTSETEVSEQDTHTPHRPVTRSQTKGDDFSECLL